MSRLRHAFPVTGDRFSGRLVTPENKRWWTLAAVSSGLFMIMLDATVANVALPAIRDSLHMKLAGRAGQRRLRLCRSGLARTGIPRAFTRSPTPYTNMLHTAGVSSRVLDQELTQRCGFGPQRCVSERSTVRTPVSLGSRRRRALG